MPTQPVLLEIMLSLVMEPRMELSASKVAAAMAGILRLSADKIDEVRFAVVEACINAFEHSHARDQKVHLRFAVLEKGEHKALKITVRDFGVGFLSGGFQGPRPAGNLRGARRRGWGLKLIKSLMDEVEISSDASGTSIIMQKYEEENHPMTDSLNIKVDRRDEIAVIYAEGYIDNQGGEAVASAAYGLIDEGFKTLLINLAGTKLINTIGISALIEVTEKMIEIEGRLGFCNLTPTIEKAFHTMGLAQYSQLFPDEASAISALAA